MRPNPATGIDRIDPRTVKALGHPLRMKLMAKLNLKVASPKELAEELGERLPNVSYHVRVLLDAGCIELVKTEPRRGAVEHFYRAQVRPFFSDEDWAKLPTSTRQSISHSVLQEIWSDVAEAMRTGVFDAREERHLTRSKLVLDEQGWLEVNEIMLAAVHRAHEIQAESISRQHTAGDNSDGLFTHLVIMHYTGDLAREIEDGALREPTRQPQPTEEAAS